MLVKDMTWISCEGLLTQPWILKSKEMAREFSRECSNEWEGTIRRDLERWMADLWLEVYNFSKEKRRWASRTDKFALGKFLTPINPKDGYAIADCEDPREWRVLEFVVPILYPKKLIRITIAISNTIFGALSGTRPVSWRVVMQEIVGKLVSRLEKEKPSSISPYLFYLYSRFECLRMEETTMLVPAKFIFQFNIAPESEAQPEKKDEDSERKSLRSEEIQKLTTVSPGSRKKSTYRALDDKISVQVPNWREVVMSSFNFQDNPFWRIQEEID